MGTDWWLKPRLTQPEYLTLTRLRRSIEHHALSCEGTVIDYGAGKKPYRPLFTKASRYIGVDFNVSEPDDLVLRSDGGIPVADRFADALVSTQVLEHVPDVPFFLAECSRVLRPGGRLLITTHGIWPYHTAPNTDDYWRWTEQGLRQIVTKAGFEVLQVDEICGGWLCLIQQALLIPDGRSRLPARVRRHLVPFACGVVNSTSTILSRLARDSIGRGNIIPICYVVCANKQ
jgi:SAM-dependent methyltransferase